MIIQTSHKFHLHFTFLTFSSCSFGPLKKPFSHAFLSLIYVILYAAFLTCSFPTQSLRPNMYPKVKVRVQREEDDVYAYGKSSLESLKAFDWLSLHHSSSSDESPVSVVRVPRSYAPKSPTPTYLLASEDTNKKKVVVEENRKNVRPSSAPRPRAVLSSPDNDGIIRSKTPTRAKLFSGLKDRPSSQNRHTRCKIFPKSSGSEIFAPTQRYHKESTLPKKETRAKDRSTIGDSSIIRARHHKKITPSPVQS